MVLYRDVPAYKKALGRADFLNRSEFLEAVQFAKIEDPASYHDEASARAIVFLQVFNLMDSSRRCSTCRTAYSLCCERRKGVAGARYMWRGQRGLDCPECENRKISASAPPSAPSSLS